MEIALLHSSVSNRNFAVHSRREAINNTALHLGLKPVRINSEARIGRAGDMDNLGLAATHIHGDDFSNNCPKAIRNRNTLCLACWQVLPPICHFCSCVQNFKVARFVFQKLSPKFIAVHISICRKFINEALGEKPMLRVINRAPWPQTNMGRAFDKLYGLVRNIIKNMAGFWRVELMHETAFPT